MLFNTFPKHISQTNQRLFSVSGTYWTTCFVKLFSKNVWVVSVVSGCTCSVQPPPSSYWKLSLSRWQCIQPPSGYPKKCWVWVALFSPRKTYNHWKYLESILKYLLRILDILLYIYNYIYIFMNWAQIIQGKRGNRDASKAPPSFANFHQPTQPRVYHQMDHSQLDRDRGVSTWKLDPHLLAKKRCIDCTLHLAEELHNWHPPTPNLLFSHAFCLKHRNASHVCFPRIGFISAGNPDFLSGQKSYGSIW